MPAIPPTLGETDFPIYIMLKWEGCFQTIWLAKEKDVQYLIVGVSSGSSLSKSNYTNGDARISEDDKHSNTNLRRVKDLFSFIYLLKASKYSRNPVFRCTSSPLFRIMSSDTLRPAWMSPTPSVKFETGMSFSLDSGLGSSVSWRALCFRITTILTVMHL